MARKNETSYKQTRYGILPRNKVLKLEVLGTKRGFLLLKKISRDNKKITPDFIKTIHKKSFGGILLKDAGKFRLVQVTYSGSEAPHFSKVPEMMKILCEDAEHQFKHLPNNKTEFIKQVVELISRFQHRFVFIHPFVDYNGRISRMFTSYILMRLNLPIIEIKADSGQTRKDYIKALKQADEGNYTKLENIMSLAVSESLEKVVEDHL